MERWQNKVAVVTGASMGIGAAIAKELALNGLRVVALARRQELIEKLIENLPESSRHLMTAMACDVTDMATVNKVFDAIIQKFGGIDILVNNAGILISGLMVAMDPLKMNAIVQTNIMGVVYCTQKAFQSMQERNVNGHVIVINSAGGHKVYTGPNADGVPSANMYSPSKFALTAMTEIYRKEFYALGTKIKITSISPGVVDTPILTAEARKAMEGRMLNPCDISQAVIYALSTPPHVQVHELIIKPLGDLI